MASTPVAKRYAQALLQIGVERDNIEKLSTQLADLRSAYESSAELRHALLNPRVRLEERRGVIRELAKKGGWEPLVINFSLLLLDKGRFQQIPGIAEEFGALVDEQLGHVRAEVTSAATLTEAQLTSIREAVAAFTGKTVLLDTEVDDELIGGVVTRVGGIVYDGSVRTQLQRLRESILAQV